MGVSQQRTTGLSPFGKKRIELLGQYIPLYGILPIGRGQNSELSWVDPQRSFLIAFLCIIIFRYIELEFRNCKSSDQLLKN
jgi:hypothetical protein